MLGRLHMTIAEAIAQYEGAASTIFGSPPPFGRLGTGPIAIAGTPLYDIKILQECVGDALKERETPEDASFIAKDSALCKVYASVHTTVSNYECTIWEAAKATVPASVFFKAVSFHSGGQFVDGGLSRNSPHDAGAQLDICISSRHFNAVTLLACPVISVEKNSKLDVLFYLERRFGKEL
ncbi:unnamed protein product [Clonostachys rosea]|uniref:PNPLA domain-containing protein n=1 Tax=Bionectria ochroleuca TaxID=29856 RepID=A0ABY6UVK3_BIOOC|nr:unnamed protein product [Clonostachys rosea]